MLTLVDNFLHFLGLPLAADNVEQKFTETLA